MYISRLISLVTAYDLDQAIPGAYVSALVVLVIIQTHLSKGSIYQQSESVALHLAHLLSICIVVTLVTQILIGLDDGTKTEADKDGNTN